MQNLQINLTATKEKHIRGVVKIREWQDARIAEYRLQNGQIE